MREESGAVQKGGPFDRGRMQKMDLQSEKLPLYIIVNTTAIMGITLGKRKLEVVGADLYLYVKTGNRQYLSGNN